MPRHRLEDRVGFLSSEAEVDLADAIREAECHTSAEIKVVIVRYCWGSIEDKAASIFHKQGLDKTAERNAVMIMVVTANRQFLIHGDEGIHSKAGQGFWDDVAAPMAERFAEGKPGLGLCEAVRTIGDKLAEHFPQRGNDVNELADEVAYEG
jgi:uncharacterized membrane protein